MSASRPVTQVLMFDGFDDLDAVAPLEVLRAAGFPARSVRPPGDRERVDSAHGLSISVAPELDATAELIVVPGGGWLDGSVGVRAQCATQLPAQLAALHAGGAVIASVCTGAMLLAAAGLLDGRPAVTNRHALDDLRRAGADVRDEARVVDDGSVVTCGGPSAGLDLAIHLVQRFCGATAADQAAERLEYARHGQTLVTAAGARAAAH
ncbi:MAG: DJ-1/PfpI family protein [Solirubrobacteraceae bacterium]